MFRRMGEESQSMEILHWKRFTIYLGGFVWSSLLMLLGQTSPSPIACLWPNISADVFQFFSLLSDLKCYRSAFSSFTNHFWNAKPKDQPTTSSKENTFSQITKRVPSHFSSFWPLLLSNLITFLFLFILNDLKCNMSSTWSSRNHPEL